MKGSHMTKLQTIRDQIKARIDELAESAPDVESGDITAGEVRDSWNDILGDLEQAVREEVEAEHDAETVRVAHIYRHYKGGLYYVEGFATVSDNSEANGYQAVIYRSLTDQKMYVRLIREFVEKVAPDGENRFTRVAADQFADLIKERSSLVIKDRVVRQSPHDLLQELESLRQRTGDLSYKTLLALQAARQGEAWSGVAEAVDKIVGEEK